MVGAALAVAARRVALARPAARWAAERGVGGRAAAEEGLAARAAVPGVVAAPALIFFLLWSSVGEKEKEKGRWVSYLPFWAVGRGKEEVSGWLGVGCEDWIGALGGDEVPATGQYAVEDADAAVVVGAAATVRGVWADWKG